jgi:3-hydroxyacyl-[acyl-carrier-protein] dehydratase
MRLEYFDMIDAVTAFDARARTLAARAVVPRESTVFEGHFPGHPLVPGVLLTETMAQASGYLLLALNGFSKMPFLMAVDSARFRTFVEPEAELEIEAEFLLEGSGYAATRARIRSGGKAACNSELRFRIMPFPAELSALMQARAEKIGLSAAMAEAGA